MVPKSFFRNVRVPDQQELAKGDVAPEDHEALHQLAKVVVVFDRDFVGYSSTALQVHASQQNGAQCCTEATGKKVNREHRAKP